MTELRDRRRAAQEELGLTNQKEKAEIQRAIQKEEERKADKEEERLRIEECKVYKATKVITKVMDRWRLDAIIGFIPIPGGIMDIFTQLLILPFIYISASKIRSVPLTLAIIYNALRDIAIGLIPFWIGDILDFFNSSYLQNMRLIVGFVEDDKDIIDEVNRTAVKSAVLIAVLCVIIVLLIILLIKIAKWIGGWLF